MKMKMFLPFALASVLVLSCRHTQHTKAVGGEPITITGTVMYLERVALSPEATVKVRMLEMPKGDEPVRPIAERTVYSPGQVPVPWNLTYLTSQVEDGREYTLEARIDIGGKTEWSNSEPIKIEPGKKGLKFDIVLKPVTGTN